MTAIINLKKSPGGPASNNKIIEIYAIDDKEFIKKEIKIISPEIVICGGTFAICEKIFEGVEEIREKLYRVRELGDMLWIKCYHPSYPIKKRLERMYYTLMEQYKKYLQKNSNP